MHKAQGMTISRLALQIGDAFEYGQASPPAVWDSRWFLRVVETGVWARVRSRRAQLHAHGQWHFKTLSIVRIGDWRQDRVASGLRNANILAEQAYVALSRATDLDGLWSFLKTKPRSV